MARLVWKKTESPEEDVAFDLGEKPLVVGRDPRCEVFIDTPLLSREHARIDFKEGAHVIVDLDSTNFTFRESLPSLPRSSSMFRLRA